MKDYYSARRTCAPIDEPFAVATVKEQASQPEVQVLRDMVCMSCASMCDDLDVTVAAGRIVHVRGACESRTRQLLGFQEKQGLGCEINGARSEFAEGIDTAARLLFASKRLIVRGIEQTSCEAQRVCVGIADRCGGWIPGQESQAILAMQQVGQSTCTWGEVANRADLVLFWGLDPLATHPRHTERYSLEPHGEFVPGGRSDRTCVLVGSRASQTARVADVVVPLRANGDFEALNVLRALLKNLVLEPGSVEAATGVALDAWSDLLSRMLKAKYGVIFYGEALSTGQGGQQRCEALFSLVRELNAATRFVCSALPARGGNVVGAENVLAWRTGYPIAVDLSRGLPRFDPSCDQQDSGDLVVTISEDAVELSTTVGAPQQVIRFSTATFGIATAGTVYRADDVGLPLRPMLQSNFPQPEEVLSAVYARLVSLQTTAESSGRS